jgi:hypothetical protein
MCFETTTKNNKDYYIISHLEQWENDNIPQTYETMIVKKKTLNMKKTIFLWEWPYFLFVATLLWAKCEGEAHTSKSGKLESSGTPENSERDCRD